MSANDEKPMDDNAAADSSPTNEEEISSADAGQEVGSRRGFMFRSAGLLGAGVIGIFGGAVSADANAAATCATAGPPTSVGDRDSSCGNGTPDAACGIVSQSSGSGKDVDQNCSIVVSGVLDIDQSCGDCDDNHDPDQTCSQVVHHPTGPSLDRDELCGHVSAFRYNKDQRAGKTIDGTTYNDEGCGVHSATYTHPVSVTDTDDYCIEPGTTAGPEGDQNCKRPGFTYDESCGVFKPAFGTSPDEHCGTGDRDEAAGGGGSHGDSGGYDIDQNCGYKWPSAHMLDTDEPCGAGSSVGSWVWTDESCGKGFANWVDTDESCGLKQPPFGLLDTDDAKH